MGENSVSKTLGKVLIKNLSRQLETLSVKSIIEDDTKNIIEYVEQSNNKKKKKFNFWKLLETNE